MKGAWDGVAVVTAGLATQHEIETTCNLFRRICANNYLVMASRRTTGRFVVCSTSADRLRTGSAYTHAELAGEWRL